jgi:predicted MFS family arabinose efflux permease
MLAVLVAATVLTVATNSMMTVLLPDIGRSFVAGPVALGWTATGALLAVAVGAPVYGLLGVRFGVRAVLTTGLIVFAAGAAVAATSPSIAVLVAARILQGIGAGAVPALTAFAVVTYVDQRRRGAAFGIIATGTGAAQASGPVVGGVLGEFAGWRAVFALAGLVAVPVLAAGLRFLPRPSSGGSGRGIDFVGVVLLASAVSALLATVSVWGQSTISRRWIWVLVTVAAIAVLGLVWRSRTARDPFIPPALGRQRGYVPACVLAAVALGVYLAVEVLVPLQVAALNDLRTGAIGLVLLPGAVLAVMVATPAGRAADRAGNRIVAAMGVFVMVVAVAVLSSTAGGDPVVVAGGMAVVDAGFVMIAVAAQNAAGSALSPQLAGVGLGIYQTGFYLSGGVGAAVGTAVLSARAGAVDSWNPLHQGAGADYADTLLLLVPVLLAGLAATTRLRRARPSG